jgi:NitT/TauT family transport system substrate-binding protein
MEKAEFMKESGSEASFSLTDRFALRRRDILIVIAVALMIGFWVYLRGNRADEGILGRPLRVGIVSWPGYAGGLVANNGLPPNKDSLFWKQHKLLVEFVEQNNETILLDDLATGKLDIIWSTVDSLAQQAPALLKKGIQPRAFMQVDWSRGGDAIISSSEIKEIEGLKGKRVAVSEAASQWLFEYSLDHSSLTEVDRTQIRQMRIHTKGGSREARELFINNKVDAAVLWEPDLKAAIDKENGRAGAHILIDTSTAPKLIADVMVTKEDFIRQRPDVIKAFVEGWLDGTTKAINDPMLAVKVLQGETGFESLSDKEIQELLPKAAWATLNDNEEMFGLSGGPVFFDQLFNQASSLWLKVGSITNRVPADQVRDTGLLTEVYNARQPLSKLNCGSENPLATIPLAIVFPPSKADLSEDAKRILDNQEALFILQTHTGARFCAQSNPVAGDAPELAVEVTRAREKVVIDYLVEHYARPRSQFVSANSSAPPADNSVKATPFIRLKLGEGN